jgi:2-polyprenyl-3-methyl-5-hydroxy-6-metoxy-1,4-benzoquinol methylase
MSYLRMSKVLLTLSTLEVAGIQLQGKSLFDYGFGAGTFFRYCPTDARLHGVELDPQAVTEVRQMLAARGHKEVRLETISIATWEQHPLLRRQYDVILCSHVLEHLLDPVAFLQRVKECLNDRGAIVGLVPLNERRADPHHIQTVDEGKIRCWAMKSGLEVRAYLESDPWVYWLQPLYTKDSPATHRLAQAVSLMLGVPATILGHRLWPALSRFFGVLTFSKPTQAAFVLARCSGA